LSKVAVGSKDGVNITEHFGKAQEFLIYEVNQAGDYQLLETRRNDFHSFDKHTNRVNILAELLSDVDVVLVSQIGPEAVSILQEKGIKAITLSVSIDKALKGYAKRGKLLENPFPFSTTQSQHGHGHHRHNPDEGCS
jgi:nitrogen fixation protein NifB